MTANRRPALLFIGLFIASCSAFIVPQHHSRSLIAQQQTHARSQLLGSIQSDIIDDDVKESPLDLHHHQSRRAFAKFGMVATIAALAANANTEAAMAVEESDEGGLIDVYFGCGCFWHVQHEFVEAEKKILGRKDDQLTARAGYAGGTAGAVDGKVCYHNAASVADYGKLGHAEVVGMKIPSSKFKDFAVEYFKLFDAKGDRPDQAGDRGGEYRSLVGVPGGAKGPYAKVLVDASIATGDKLDFAFGKGDDKDARKTSFVMDSEKFPFYVAEQYHQFHDGFNLNENYPSSYNNLASTFAKSGEDFGSCPKGSLGLGIAGL
uniref:peptide-methionine (S)-S-oxide reductase n=1 Tax=Attheya septentrionalis TaxID=420275 RepID=A0A7S2UCK1_9STRA|mmetsp:Transcript_18038/g.32707  ORF Transcript_18038/g.32707 Transcript_18038/m.32707 type:complete len:320 (+) Transcript_18038:78-1037(+)|eukprot:CAMPEP_0198294926 /NCGR_PEP_ID=MMETSP1449-20131203/24763_1 /TAXON_ID=420275 /ORGANISM="Attheya septentrionalis, Strain CCMP2084" /LENGTH=319 /DNA_ID=CAMNT_0043995027 /DNA_START=71 /DNA_END=1030 /DNA_ORIENTATION=-